MRITGLKRTYEEVEVDAYILFNALQRELYVKLDIPNNSFLKEKEGKNYWTVDDWNFTDYLREATLEEIEAFESFHRLFNFMVSEK